MASTRGFTREEGDQIIAGDDGGGFKQPFTFAMTTTVRYATGGRRVMTPRATFD